jgi:hypothetical protein
MVLVLSAPQGFGGSSNKDRIYYRDYQENGQAPINYVQGFHWLSFILQRKGCKAATIQSRCHPSGKA